MAEFVRNLDRSNFNDTVRGNDFVVVNFTHPEAFNPDCDDFAQTYENVAKLLSIYERFVVVKVDAKKEKRLAAEYFISRYPTIKIFRNRDNMNAHDYHGPLDAEGFTGCLMRLRGPFPVLINSSKDADNLIRHKKGIVIVCILHESHSLQKFKNFIAVAEKLKLYFDFGYTFDAQHIPPWKSSVHAPVVRVFKSFRNEEQFVDTTDFNVDALVNFVEEASKPIVTFADDDPQLVSKFFHTNIENAKAMLFINLEGQSSNGFKSKYHEVAKKNKEHGIRFMLGDFEASKHVFEYFDVHKSLEPLIVIRDSDDKIYVKRDFEPDDIAAWVEKYKAGEVLCEPDSQENKGHVKEVVGTSFQEMVMDSGKNVFLVVGPWCHWCEQCTKLAPTLVEVAAHFEKEKDADVVIAKLYTNAHDIRRNYDLGVEGYPTMCFKRASGKKKLKLYHGCVSTGNIIEFIKKNKNVARPPEIKSTKDSTTFIRDEKIVIVGIFPNFSGKEYVNFIKAYKRLKSDYYFCLTSNAKNLPRGDLSVSGPAVRLFKPFDEGYADFQDFDFANLVKFVKYASKPDVTLYNGPSQFVEYAENGEDQAMLFIDLEGQGVDAFKSTYHEVAKKYKGRGIRFMLGGLEAMEPVFRFFGVSASEGPLIFFRDLSSKIYLKPVSKPEDIEEGVYKYQARDIEVYGTSKLFRTAVTVDADWLQKMVDDPGKIFLLVVYGYKWVNFLTFSLALNDVAAHFKKQQDMYADFVIGMMIRDDVDYNPTVQKVLVNVLHQYTTLSENDKPTLFLKTTSGKIEVYDGDMTVKSIIDFINEKIQ